MAYGIRTSATYLESLFGLCGRVAVVTGGSSGIGRAMATALGMAGAAVIVVARRPGPVQNTVDYLSSKRVEAHGLHFDVRDADAISNAVIKQWGVPDILVNAAGINTRVHMDHLSAKDWDETIAVNLTAPFALGQKF